MLGVQKFYFIPNVLSGEFIAKNDYVIATEFDNVDNTFKVRFLNGDAVQMWAVADTQEELKVLFDRFQEYRAFYNECREAVRPHENRLRAKYEELFSGWMNVEFGQIIADRHNPEKMISKEEENASEANV